MKRITLIFMLCIVLFCSCNTSTDTTADEEYITYLEERITKIEEYTESIEGMVSSINNELTNEDVDIPLELIIEEEPTEPVSAYERWIETEMTTSEREMYESMYEGWYIMDDEVSRGWIDNGTRKFLELLTGKDLTEATVGEIKQTYNDLGTEINYSGYSIRDFFTVNEYGDTLNTGIYNFLRTVESFETNEEFMYMENIENLVRRNDENQIIGFDFSVIGGDDVVADILGISEELVLIILHAVVDAGFDISFE